MHTRVGNREIRKPSSIPCSLVDCVKGEEVNTKRAQRYDAFAKRFHSAARLGLN
jgi:hypothetical protein